MVQSVKALQREILLTALETTGAIRPAAHIAGLHHSTVYRWKQSDPAFAAAYKRAIERHYQRFAQEATARHQQWLVENERRRAQRLEELRPLYQQLAANARAARKRKRGY